MLPLGALHKKILDCAKINYVLHLQYLRISLKLDKLYLGPRFSGILGKFGIEVYLYTKGNIIIPRDTSGVYGSTFVKYMPKENTSHNEKIFVYKNVMKPLDRIGHRCTNDMAKYSVGRCIVNNVEETINCTAYQIFANKTKDICNRTQYFYSMMMHKDFSDLSEAEIYKFSGCLPHCEHDEIQVKSIGEPLVYPSRNPTFTLEFQFEDGSYHTTEEYIVYDTDSFLADIGGYLGLLLGHSILSVYSGFVDWLSKGKIWKKICKRRRDPITKSVA